MKINLFQNYYLDHNPARKKELDQCHSFNMFNRNFDKKIFVEGRPTYNDYFRHTRKYPDCINVIANSDIYFDNSILLLKDINWKANTCIALSRWDLQDNGSTIHFERSDSQDVWAFYGGVPKIEGADFTLGIAGCDNVIAYLLNKSGYRIYNPSRDIKTIHYHVSGVRNYINGTTIQRLPPPYLTVDICGIADIK
jgi:hypothetical protein